MLPLAVALTLAVGPAPGLSAAEHSSRIELRLPRAGGCANIDPGIVRYVAPPEGRGPLWRVKELDPRYLDFGPAVKARGPQTPPPLSCPRLQPVTAR